MSSLRARRLSPIGVDVGSAWIKAAQVSQTRRGWRLHAGAAFPRLEPGVEPGAPEFARLAEVLDRAGFEGQEVVIGAPRAILHTAVLDLPPRTSGAPIEQICQAEVVRMFRLPADAFEMFAWEMPSASPRIKSTQMLASAVECDEAEALVGACEGAGLQVVAIDLGSEATSRACRSLCQEGPDLTVLLDLGSAGVEMFVYREGDCVYQRWLEGIGTGAIVATLVTRLRIPSPGAELLVRRLGLYQATDVEADPVLASGAAQIMREHTEGLIGAVLSSASYALDRFPGEVVGRLKLVGAGAGMAGLAEYLGDVAGMEVEVIRPQDWGRVAPGSPGPAIMTAIGHAMWGRG